jgi:hypothetical protein
MNSVKIVEDFWAAVWKAPQDVDAIDRFVLDDSLLPRAASTLLLRILFEDRDPEQSFRMGVTAAVTIQGYRGTDNNQE